MCIRDSINTKRGSITIVKETVGGAGTFEFTSSTLTPSPFNLTTTAAGEAGKVDTAFTSLLPGTYDVAETDPTPDFDLTSATCDDGSPIDDITVDPGETVTCTFTNTQDPGRIIVDKVTIPPGDPTAFDFTLSGGPAGLDESFTLTDTAPPYDSGPIPAGSGSTSTSRFLESGMPLKAVSLPMSWLEGGP